MPTLKSKRGSKSTANVTVPNVNDNHKVLSMNVAGKTLNNRRCLSILKTKRKTGPKSRTMSVKERDISANTENKVTVTKKTGENGVITNNVYRGTETNFKVPQINTDTGKTLNNKKWLTTNLLKRKFRPRSKTMCAEDRVLSNSENSNSEIINYKKSKKNLSNYSLVTTLKLAENPNSCSGKILNNVKCLSTSIPKRKPGPKSRTRYVEHCVSSNTENKETITNKICINDGKVINNDKSTTTNLSDISSAKIFKDAENTNQNLFNNFSSRKYPPPYPITPLHKTLPSWKTLPPVPEMKIDTLGNNVTLTWNLKLSSNTAEIKRYELFVCKENDAPPDISMWKKKGSLNPDIMLPMACELEMFDLGYIYHFALRAVDIYNRCARFGVLRVKI